MAKKSKEVRLVEVEPHAEQYFTLAKNELPEPLQKKLLYYTQKAEARVELVQGTDICIVDPPRKGLGSALLQRLLNQKGLKQLAYISCDYTSLERDLAFIQQAFANWRPTFATSYLFFPGTNQIETLVICSKISAQNNN